MTLNDSVSFSYEIFIINANHDHNNDTNPFTRQFPGNEKGFLFTYLLFSIFYVILIPVHLLSHLKYTIKCRTPQIINLFSLALVFEGINIFCGLIHYGVYAHNGYGAPPLNYMKTFFNLVGDWFLIIVLVLIAGGWMVTLKIVKWRLASFIFIFLYIFVTIIYYIATVIYMNLQPWDTFHPLQEWPGGIYLTARGLLLFYVWYQIYHIHRQEDKLRKLRLYRALFGIFTAWFWYLPITVFIVTLINPVVSWVVLINIMNTMNFIVNVVMTALFCPFWSHEYFQFQFNVETSSMTSALMNSSSYTKKYQMMSGNSYDQREDKDLIL
ncbi:PREDICTED: uncharacterized protein LOC109590793 [Amphimedon queenslandica]|uniref:GPR180/TMEM145 transmembrane domain-containing protein n=1 Tax=Amphimedon queenslandica TaxID=400682 RepID=A0A1X7SZ03_AMPQE|nr:PREDICTED: uncharacterized protein LOC109590793 [Amphimedon queenslandica]|eukprot:XP_019862226.1 PREDICTED: uncharacterized protein LOC109590793 [Amphimedon queenslandica]